MPSSILGPALLLLLLLAVFVPYNLISYINLLQLRFGILKSQICMVGDRLDTDILFGQNGGCKTLLVLSGIHRINSVWIILASISAVLNRLILFIWLIGVTSLSMLQSPDNSIQPDFYTNKISDFLSLKATALWSLKLPRSLLLGISSAHCCKFMFTAVQLGSVGRWLRKSYPTTKMKGDLITHQHSGIQNSEILSSSSFICHYHISITGF